MYFNFFRNIYGRRYRRFNFSTISFVSETAGLDIETN